jgi:hypothetical protein
MNTLTRESKPTLIERFLKYELSYKQMCVGTVLFFTLLVLFYMACMVWGIHQIVNYFNETAKASGPIVVVWSATRLKKVFRTKKGQ